jgi:hypothetical protein
VPFCCSCGAEAASLAYIYKLAWKWGQIRFETVAHPALRSCSRPEPEKISSSSLWHALIYFKFQNLEKSFVFFVADVETYRVNSNLASTYLVEKTVVVYIQ